MGNVQRVGISVEDVLLRRFDKLIGRAGYANRSEAIRDLIRDKLTAEQLTDPKTRAVAAVFVVYDHHQHGLAQKLTGLQHSHLFKTISSMHVHIGHHDCLSRFFLEAGLRR